MSSRKNYRLLGKSHGRQQRDVAFYILTETSLADELKADYPNGNLIYREDYQKSFKKGVRWADTKSFLGKYAYFKHDVIVL